MDVVLTTNLEFHFNACFWVLEITCFLLIYDKPYNRSKFRIRISKSIGRFFLTRFPGHVTRKRKRKEISTFVIKLQKGKTKKRKFSVSESWIVYFFRISSYGKFPDLRIRFCEKRTNKHLEFYDKKTLQMSKIWKNHRVLSFIFFPIFEDLFWIHYWWRHEYESSRKTIKSKTSDA